MTDDSPNRGARGRGRGRGRPRGAKSNPIPDEGGGRNRTRGGSPKAASASPKAASASPRAASGSPKARGGKLRGEASPRPQGEPKSSGRGVPDAPGSPGAQKPAAKARGRGRGRGSNNDEGNRGRGRGTPRRGRPPPPARQPSVDAPAGGPAGSLSVGTPRRRPRGPSPQEPSCPSPSPSPRDHRSRAPSPHRSAPTPLGDDPRRTPVRTRGPSPRPGAIPAEPPPAVVEDWNLLDPNAFIHTKMNEFSALAEDFHRWCLAFQVTVQGPLHDAAMKVNEMITGSVRWIEHHEWTVEVITTFLDRPPGRYSILECVQLYKDSEYSIFEKLHTKFNERRLGFQDEMTGLRRDIHEMMQPLPSDDALLQDWKKREYNSISAWQTSLLAQNEYLIFGRLNNMLEDTSNVLWKNQFLMVRALAEEAKVFTRSYQYFGRYIDGLQSEVFQYRDLIRKEHEELVAKTNTVLRYVMHRDGDFSAFAREEEELYEQNAERLLVLHQKENERIREILGGNPSQLQECLTSIQKCQAGDLTMPSIRFSLNLYRDQVKWFNDTLVKRRNFYGDNWVLVESRRLEEDAFARDAYEMAERDVSLALALTDRPMCRDIREQVARNQRIAKSSCVENALAALPEDERLVRSWGSAFAKTVFLMARGLIERRLHEFMEFRKQCHEGAKPDRATRALFGQFSALERDGDIRKREERFATFTARNKQDFDARLASRLWLSEAVKYIEKLEAAPLPPSAEGDDEAQAALESPEDQDTESALSLAFY